MITRNQNPNFSSFFSQKLRSFLPKSPPFQRKSSFLQVEPKTYLQKRCVLGRLRKSRPCRGKEEFLAAARNYRSCLPRQGKLLASAKQSLPRQGLLFAAAQQSLPRQRFFLAAASSYFAPFHHRNSICPLPLACIPACTLLNTFFMI